MSSYSFVRERAESDEEYVVLCAVGRRCGAREGREKEGRGGGWGSIDAPFFFLC